MKWVIYNMTDTIKNKYGGEVKKESLIAYCKEQKNRYYEMLCLREEEKNWKRFLHSKLLEYSGKHKYFEGKINYLSIVAKSEELYEMEYKDYRKTIFEIMTCFDRLVEEIKEG